MVSVARRFLVNFLVGFVAAGCGGVVFVSCRLGECAVFSEVVEDHLSLEEGYVSFAFFLSASLSVIPCVPGLWFAARPFSSFWF